MDPLRVISPSLYVLNVKHPCVIIVLTLGLGSDLLKLLLVSLTD